MSFATPTVSAPPPGWSVASYRFDADPSITVERAPQPDGSDLWAVRRSGCCLAKDGMWEYEPMPSSRGHDGFMERCRFASVGEAIACAMQNKGSL